jgi:hypothetical protein
VGHEAVGIGARADVQMAEVARGAGKAACGRACVS